MKVLPPERLSPEENMKRDWDLLLALEEGRGVPTFRLYEWDKVCLSIGYSQKPPGGLSIPVVRRPTGGGALIHGWDLSFAIVDLRERWGGSVCSIHSSVSGFLKEVFSKVGVDLKVERFRGRYLERYYCFFVPTFGELTFRGRKVVAMAMRTLKRAFLVHGSFYLRFDYHLASKLLGVNEEDLRRRVLSLEEMGIRKGDIVEAFLSAIYLRCPAGRPV